MLLLFEMGGGGGDWKSILWVWGGAGTREVLLGQGQQPEL